MKSLSSSTEELNNSHNLFSNGILKIGQFQLLNIIT